MKNNTSFTISDIIKRRYSKAINSSNSQIKVHQKSLISMQSNAMDYLEDIINKINSKIQLNLKDKNDLIDIMSEKTSCSFNKSVILQNIHSQKCQNIHILQRAAIKLKKNYFLLYGNLLIYQKRKNIKESKINKMIESGSLRQTNKSFQQVETNYFENISTFELQCLQYTLIDTIQGLRGIGFIFGNKDFGKNLIVVAQNAIVVTIKNSQFDQMIVNDGGIDPNLKSQIIQKFPIFNCLGKKIQHFLQYFELKKYVRNQILYKINQQPSNFYLIVKGQIILDSKLNLLKKNYKQNHKKINNQSPKHNTQITINTQSLFPGHYFGQQQILNNTTRKLTARCQSAFCQVLQLSKQKFQRLLDYDDFYDSIKKSSENKILQRLQKLQLAGNIYNKYQNCQDKKVNHQQGDNFTQFQQNLIFGKNIKKKNNKFIKNVKIMHGNLVRSYTAVKNDQENIQFSMLGVNKQMYQTTLKKFKKYTKKPIPIIKPKIKFNLERVWKVLNLQNVLRQDTQIVGEQGRKYYQSYRRLTNHVNQIKSLRPKTSSSTYRNKLQYIAFLQQFNADRQ